jgi:hypothetical protein
MSVRHKRTHDDRSHVIRRANDGIAAKAAALRFVSRVPMLCECGDPACRELVLLTLAEYRRAHQEHDFLTVPGHRGGSRP